MSNNQFGKYTGPSVPNEVHPTSLPRARIEDPNARFSKIGAPSFQSVVSRTYQRPAVVVQHVVPSKPSNGTPANNSVIHHAKRTTPPYFPSPGETLKKARGSLDGLSDANVTYHGQSPPKIFQKNLNVGGQNPHTVSALQLQHSPIWINKSPSHNINHSAQEPIFIDSRAQSTPIFRTERPRSPIAPLTTQDSIVRPYTNTRNLIDYRDLDAPDSVELPSVAVGNNSYHGKSPRSSGENEKPFPAYQMHVHEDLPAVTLESWNYQSQRRIKHSDGAVSNGTRSPAYPSPGLSFMQDSAVPFGGQRIYDRRSPGIRSESPYSTSEQTGNIDVHTNKLPHLPVASVTDTPLTSSSDHAFQKSSDHSEEIVRELNAKEKRVARFRDELIQPMQSQTSIKNQKFPARGQHQTPYNKQKFDGNGASDVIGNSGGGDASSDYEGIVSSHIIVGSCPEMCPESERGERERKGDLDLYERLDGDRNLTCEFLAVKKYNRTAEREAELIRPNPVLQMTMDYLLNLLHKPYDHRFLGLYNFLWDRMRAIRMDLRMQHIFNLEAINMLEQMIRLHIIAMHELCEHTKGEGFSEGFDAHLNIEQMNKTSVELFQLYDDHRKKGIHVPSEKEFRGYYALLKLDKHPGYKVEPAELSLDLAKMAPEMRKTAEVLFARDVARACRASNFVAFFRLANKATYLQACLMHAHFFKLRSQALASLHSGLQTNQGIPIAHVAKWLGMEEEDMGEILGFHGFSMKDFEEPYLVKESAYISAANEIPTKRSKLVERKRSGEIVNDVLYSSVPDTRTPKEVKEFKPKNGPVAIFKVSSSAEALNSTPIQDEEMIASPIIKSPKSRPRKPAYRPPTEVMAEVQDVEVGGDVQMATLSSSALDASGVIPVQPQYTPIFRNSFGGSIRPEIEAQASMSPGVENGSKYSALPFVSAVHTPSSLPHFEVLEDAQQATDMEHVDTSDVPARNNHDEVVIQAKLKLILRKWRRHAAKKREFREHKLLAANSALGLLSLGPPIWKYEDQPCHVGALDIERAMKKRHEIQEQSLSLINPSAVIASELVEKNPEHGCLSWKLLLCTQELSFGYQNKAEVPASCAWLKSKLLPENRDDESDLLISSPGLAIWRSWIRMETDPNEICCISVIRHCTSEAVDNINAGASAVLFLSAEDVSLEFRKQQLFRLIMSLPPGSRLPLLVLSDSRAHGSNSASIAQDLGLHEINESRVSKVHVAFLRNSLMEHMDEFFSDECLREGLRWLAGESPPEIALSEIKTRDLVLSHLNSRTMKPIEEADYRRVKPNDCISAFNEALDLSMEGVAAAARANPTGWPCPEIKLLDKSSDEYKFASWFLPSTGWSSSTRTELLMRAFSSSKLPALWDDCPWLSQGIHSSDDFENQKLRLGSCIFNYLTETSKMVDATTARNEAGVLVQNFTRLELLDSTHYIIPKWSSIFRRLYNWRLLNFSSGELSSTYVLAQGSDPSQDNRELKAAPLSSPYVVPPSLDELMQVGPGFSPDHVDHKMSAVPSDDPDSPTSQDNAVLMDEVIGAQGTDNGNWFAQETSSEMWSRRSEEADRLSKLLDKCNIVQNKIDKMLSIYF